MSVIVDILSWLLIVAGSGFMLIGAWGTVKFPDFWSRLHAVSVSDSAGMILLSLGMCMQAGFTLIAVKLLIMIGFLFITGPSATHAVANAALMSGSRPQEGKGLISEFDESKVAQPPVRPTLAQGQEVSS